MVAGSAWRLLTSITCGELAAPTVVEPIERFETEPTATPEFAIGSVGSGGPDVLSAAIGPGASVGGATGPTGTRSGVRTRESCPPSGAGGSRGGGGTSGGAGGIATGG